MFNKINVIVCVLRLMAAEATRNEIAKTCNSMSDWAKQTQQKLDKTMGAAQMGKQHVENLKEIDEQVRQYFFM